MVHDIYIYICTYNVDGFMKGIAMPIASRLVDLDNRFLALSGGWIAVPSSLWLLAGATLVKITYV